MEVAPRKRLFGRTFRRRIHRESLECSFPDFRDAHDLRSSGRPRRRNNFVGVRLGNDESLGNVSQTVTNRPHGSPKLHIASSLDDDVHDDPNDPLVASICNLLRAPPTPPPACSYHSAQSKELLRSFVERDAAVRGTIQGDPVREAVLATPAVDDLDSYGARAPYSQADTVGRRSDGDMPTRDKSERPFASDFVVNDLDICYDDARSVAVSQTRNLSQDGNAPTMETHPTSAQPLYIPNTITHTPEERYQARSERAGRVAAALEKLAGSLPAGNHIDGSISYLLDNLHDIPSAPLASPSMEPARDKSFPAFVSAKQHFASFETFPSSIQDPPISSPSKDIASAPRSHKSTRHHLVDPIRFPLCDDIIPLVIESMAQHRTDPCVADKALTTLRRLTTRDAARDRIGTSGGVEAVVDVMRLHSLRIRIQTQSCLVLANLTYRNSANKERVLRARGFQAVVASMSLHRNIEHIQAWGCLALRNFSNSRFTTSEEITLVAGAVDVLLSALEVCTESAVVQNQAPVALGNIAASSPVGISRIRETGGIQSIVCACRRNISSATLTEGIMSCVRALIVDERNQRVFGQHEGIEVITQCMTYHRGHMGIIVKGCASFRYLSFLKENRERLGTCGGIHAIVSAMADTNTSNEDVVEHILKALSNSTYDSYANKSIAGAAGGITATLNLISKPPFRDSARVAEDGCRVLRNLADGVLANHELILKHRGLATVLDVVRTHGPLNEGVAEHGVALFVNLATNKSIAYQLRHGSGDLFSAAHHMCAMHASSEKVNRQVSNLLQLLDMSESWGHSSPSLKLNRGLESGPQLRRFGSGPARPAVSARSGLFASSGSDSLTRRMRIFRFGGGDTRRRDNISLSRHF